MNKTKEEMNTVSFKFDENGDVHIERASLTESQVIMSLQRKDRSNLEYFKKHSSSFSYSLR